MTDEWDALADDLVRWMLEHGPHPLNDVVIHEQDLRGAVALPGAQETPGFAVVRDRMGGRLLGSALEAGGFDLGRALTSRRTAGQLRSWVTRGDVEPHPEASVGLGPLPQRPLPEQPRSHGARQVAARDPGVTGCPP